jgi:pimeloyl-ACP methyl ester carboxylesterase
MQNEKQTILITVHGIRTFGEWQERLNDLVVALNPQTKIEKFGYGYFSVVSFFLPFLRWLAARYFQKKLESRLAEHGDSDYLIVAHSFGTYLVARALRNLPQDSHYRIRLVILAGSVLKSRFDWTPILRNRRVDRVVNDCGINDKILVLSQLFVPFTGMAGRIGFFGFTNHQISNRYFVGGHSLYFNKANENAKGFMEQHWVPLLLNREFVPVDQRATPSVMGGIGQVLLMLADPIKISAYTLLVLFSLYFIYWLPHQRALEEESLRVSKEAVELQSSGKFAIAFEQALAVLNSDLKLIPESYRVVYNELFNSAERKISLGKQFIQLQVASKLNGDIVVLNDSGDLIVSSPLGESKLRRSDVSFILAPLSPSGDFVFLNDYAISRFSKPQISRFSTDSQESSVYSTGSLSPDEAPGLVARWIDNQSIVSCDQTRLFKHSLNQDNAGNNVVRIEESKELPTAGTCEVLAVSDDQLIVATSDAEISRYNLSDLALVARFNVGSTTGALSGLSEIVATNDVVAISTVGQTYLFDNLGNVLDSYVGDPPKVSSDFGYIFYNATANLTILRLENGQPKKEDVNCKCKFIGFRSPGKYLTLDRQRNVIERNIADRNEAHQVNEFGDDIREAYFFPDTETLLGVHYSGEATVLQLDAPHNSFRMPQDNRSWRIKGAAWLDQSSLVIQSVKWQTGEIVQGEVIFLSSKGKAFEIAWAESLSAQSLNRDETWIDLVAKKLNISNEKFSKLFARSPVASEDIADIRISGDVNYKVQELRGRIFAVDRRTDAVVFETERPPLLSSVWIGPGLQKIAFGTADGKLQLWDSAEVRSPVFEARIHGSRITGIVSNLDDTSIATFSGDGLIRFWPIVSRDQLITAACTRREPNSSCQTRGLRSYFGFLFSIFD